MKRYIRTENGMIFDTQKPIEQVFSKNGKGGFKIMPNVRGAIKEADTIEELIQVGDLVKFGGSGSHRIVSSYYFKSNKERDYTSFKDYEGVIYDTQYITELYTKQGRNYILVAEKIEKGWKVL